MKRQFESSWGRDRRGNVAIYFAVASFAIAGLAGGALTMSRLSSAQSRLQDFADGSALAAAVQARDPRATDAEVREAAVRFGRAAMSAGPHETTPATIGVQLTRGAPSQVTVTFDQEVRTILAGFVGQDRIRIRRSATAILGPQRRTCLHVLEPVAPAALDFGGNPKLDARDCVVQLNSTAAGALKVQGAAGGQALATYVAGPASPAKGWSPAPLFDQPPNPDPYLSRVVWPTPVSNCIPQPSGTTLQPDAYCSGLRLEDGMRLEPGLYVIQSGGISVRGRGARGQGVTLVMLDPAGSLDINGNAPLTISARTTGDWAGIAIAARPGPTPTRSVIHGQLEIDGALYLPGHALRLQGNAAIGGTAGTRSVIVRQLSARGTPNLDLAGGHPSGVFDPPRLSR